MTLLRLTRASLQLLVQVQHWIHQSNMWNLFKLYKKAPERRHWHCLGVFNVAHTLLWCFYYWLWTSKCQLSNSLQSDSVLIFLSCIVVRFHSHKIVWHHWLLMERLKATDKFNIYWCTAFCHVVWTDLLKAILLLNLFFGY